MRGGQRRCQDEDQSVRTVEVRREDRLKRDEEEVGGGPAASSRTRRADAQRGFVLGVRFAVLRFFVDLLALRVVFLRVVCFFAVVAEPDETRVEWRAR
jgi:hypothetical protein